MAPTTNLPSAPGTTSLGAAGNGAPPFEVSLPDEYKNHEISDDQLNLLHRGGKMSKGLSNAFWTVVGGALSSVAPALLSIHGAYIKDTPVPLSEIDLIQIVIFSACIVLGIAILVIEHHVVDPVDSLVKQIKERTNIVTR